MTTQRTDLINEVAIAYMRQNTINWTLVNARPTTKLYAFFDGVPVDSRITQTGQPLGVSVVTDSSGSASGTFAIDDFTYTTGTKTLKFQDSFTYSTDVVPGSTVSSAEATFTSAGILKTTRDVFTDVSVSYITNTITNVVTTVDTINRVGCLGDPLAQSFFTHGVSGGIHVSKIDVFFQTKEENGGIPVTLEIRPMVAGYPSPLTVSQFSKVVKLPADINVSSTGNIATSFVFDVPVYLPENGDYCFVLISNSDKYHVWTAKIGEKSQETGKLIFEQPFIGTLFKSENNITWTTDSTEDMKFVIHKAKFDTASSNVTLKAEANKILLHGRNMSVVSGSNVIKIKFDHRHGLRNSDKLRIYAPTGNHLYRGISNTIIGAVYAVNLIDEYTITVQLTGGTFTSTGTLESPGIVNEIQVDSGGAGYNSDTSIIINGAATIRATAELTITDGKIVGVTVTNTGNGYVSAPTYTLNNVGSGVGAQLYIISETIFAIETNRIYDEAIPRFLVDLPPSTEINSTIKSTDLDYTVQPLKDIRLNKIYSMPKRSLLLSNINGVTFKPGQTTTEIIVGMKTYNANTSPIVSLSENPTLDCISYVVNNQTELETITPGITSSSASINDITFTGGSGYTPGTSISLTISKPDVLSGVQAAATVTITLGVVTALTMTNVGSGYLKTPTVTLSQTGVTPTVNAIFTPVLSAFNSELLPSGGTAQSRYISKPIGIETVSIGAKVLVNAYSEANSAFDVYIRTSLRSSKVSHTGNSWVMLNCDVSRNRSTSKNQFLDYEFYISNLAPFDVYDIKIVMRTTNRNHIPSIGNYRTIILAT